MDVLEYLDRSIATFAGDPPVNDYQRGCLDTLKIARAELASIASSKWQPKDSAPRDGTPFLTFVPGNNHAPFDFAFWDDEIEEFIKHGCGWQYVTHWHPLPASPAQSTTLGRTP